MNHYPMHKVVARLRRRMLSSAAVMRERIRQLNCAVLLCTLLLANVAAQRQPTRRVANSAPGQSMQVDLLLRRGKVLDGSGAPPRVADVGIRGDRIAFIGDATRAHVTATRTIDVRGLCVAPGFIDPHTHTMEDLSDPARKSNENYLTQGVTTVVTGNDGSSAMNIAAQL